MELGSIMEFLNNKSILVIGATGFLAKVFVEKILRVQPKVKKLYLLLRAVDTKSAEERLHHEVIGMALFDVLREQHGASLYSFVYEKVTPVPGDISCVDLGIRDSLLKDQIWNEIDTVINCAATTDFDESLRMRRRCRIDTGEAISLGQSQERHGNDRHRHRKETGQGEIEETPLRTC